MGKVERETRALRTRAVWLGALAAADLRAENFGHPAQYAQAVITTALDALIGNGVITVAPQEDWPTTFITVPPYTAPEPEKVPHIDDIVASAEGGRQFMELSPENVELPAGSIVMLYSRTGTAVQKHYDDGAWHGSTGQTYSWADLFQRRDGLARAVFLVYAAPVEN